MNAVKTLGVLAVAFACGAVGTGLAAVWSSGIRQNEFAGTCGVLTVAAIVLGFACGVAADA